MTKLYVSNKDESIRMFRSNVFEKLSRVHPTVPHVIFVPVILFMWYLSYRREAGLGDVVLLFFGGLLLWSFTEYVVHRFVFHVTQEAENRSHETVSRLGTGEAVVSALDHWEQTRYWVLHGVHHDYPNDSKRLVMPPGVSVPLAFLFYYLFAVAVGAVSGPALFAGFAAGYLVYDTTHYAVHHHRARTWFGRYLKKHHFRHHYLNPRKDFGVSSPIWDLVFGTLGRSERQEGA
jgi:sterol desaturase/sphingolipid hydroxylase (fatty acid hydroxylase superfamily)